MFIFCLLAILSPCLVSGIIEEKDVNLSEDEMMNFQWFGFEEGGSVEAKLTLDEPMTTHIQFFICHIDYSATMEEIFDSESCSDAVEEFVNDCYYHTTIYYFTVSSALQDPGFQQFLRDHAVLAGSLSTDALEEYITKYSRFLSTGDEDATHEVIFDIEEPGIYEFILVYCQSEPISFELEYVFMNPDGEHLSIGVREIKYVMLYCGCAWGLMLVAWVVDALCTRTHKLNLIQGCLVLDAVFWVAFAWVFHAFWEDYSDEGIQDETLKSWSFILGSSAECLLFGTVELTSNGNGIVKPQLQTRGLWIAVVLMTMITLFYWLFLLEGALFLYLLAGAYFFVLVVFVVQINRNLRDLREWESRLIDIAENPAETATWAKIRNYMVVRSALILFIGLLSGVSLLTIFCLEYYPWVTVSSHLTLLWFLYGVLYWYSRFKKGINWFSTDEFEELDDPKTMRFKLGPFYVVKHPGEAIELAIPLPAHE